MPYSKCKVKLFNEHGSSFFKFLIHYKFLEEDLFNSVVVYRKNYPFKKNKNNQIGVSRPKIPFWVLFLRLSPFKKKYPIFIGAQIYSDLKNNYYRYLLNTNFLNQSFFSLFDLMTKNKINIGFIPSKDVRRGQLQDPIYNYAIKKKLKF